MSLTIELPDAKAAALTAKARARGLSAEEYARHLVEQDLAPEWLRESWHTATKTGLDQLSREEIEAEIAAARASRRNARPNPGA